MTPEEFIATLTPETLELLAVTMRPDGRGISGTYVMTIHGGQIAHVQPIGNKIVPQRNLSPRRVIETRLVRIPTAEERRNRET